MGSATIAKTMGMVSVCCSSAVVVGVVENDIGLKRDKFLSKSSHRRRVVRCRPASVDLGVTALSPPELLEPLPERRDMGLYFQVALSITHQHTNPSHTLALLPARRNRPRNRRRAAEQRDELAPPHSITSSARASKVAGTLMPSAFAVIRLTMRSNLVGCSTGMLAGFAPRRILST